MPPVAGGAAAASAALLLHLSPPSRWHSLEREHILKRLARSSPNPICCRARSTRHTVPLSSRRLMSTLKVRSEVSIEPIGKWLVAMPYACDDPVAVRNIKTLCKLPISKLLVNSYMTASGKMNQSECLPLLDDLPSTCNVEQVEVAGFKPAFWKTSLAPSAVRGYSMTWSGSSTATSGRTRGRSALRASSAG